MRPSRKVVVHTRKAPLPQKTLAGLKARGITVINQPLLQTKRLAAQVPAIEGYQAVILTSVAALDALADAPAQRDTLLFVVGSATADAAAKAGFSAITSAPSATELAKVIRESVSPDAGPLLYLAGRDRARDMTRLLDRFQVEVIEVYAAEKASSLKPEVRRAFKRGEVFTVTVYSARAAEALAAAVDRAGVGAEARKASALCLSPRITARLQSRGWREARSVSPPDTSGISAQLLGVRGPFLEESRNRGAAIPSTVQKSEPSAVPSPMEPSMTTPTPPPARSGPGWPAFIILAIVAIAGGAWLWYMAQERQAELTAQLSGIRQELAAIEADPGREERAALAERTAELEETGAGADFETLNELIAEARALSESVAEAEQLARQTAATNTEALAGLTGQTRELTVTVSDMQERLNTLASKQEERFSALAERLDTAQEELATAKEALQERSQRLQETQAAVGELRSMIDSLESWAEDMQPARLAERLIALGDLRRVVNAGAPFSAALERAAKAIPAVKEAEGDWLDWADNGIPTEEELTRRLAQIEKDLPPPATADADGGVVDRALGVLLGGIQIEGKGTLVDDPVRSAIVEAQEAMKQDDHAAAKAALAPVADDVEPVAEWLKALSARTSAEAAIQHWENTVLAEVGESVQ